MKLDENYIADITLTKANSNTTANTPANTTATVTRTQVQEFGPRD